MALTALPAVIDVFDNDTFDWTVIVTQPAEDENDPPEPVDLTGVTAACMQWRPEAGSAHVALHLSMANGRLFVTSAEEGEVAFLVAPAILRAVPKRQYTADIVFTISGRDRRCAFGTIDLKSGASHC